MPITAVICKQWNWYELKNQNDCKKMQVKMYTVWLFFHVGNYSLMSNCVLGKYSNKALISNNFFMGIGNLVMQILDAGKSLVSFPD